MLYSLSITAEWRDFLELTFFSEFVGPKEKDLDLDVSDDQIFKNRMSKSEISALPKFCNHESGSPSEVSVYNKQVSLRMIIKIQAIIRQHPKHLHFCMNILYSSIEIYSYSYMGVVY